jgi:hypothetical protein
MRVGIGQATTPTTPVYSPSNPFQGQEGLTILTIGLTVGPLFLPGWWKLLAVAGPLLFLTEIGGIH